MTTRAFVLLGLVLLASSVGLLAYWQSSSAAEALPEVEPPGRASAAKATKPEVELALPLPEPPPPPRAEVVELAGAEPEPAVVPEPKSPELVALELKYAKASAEDVKAALEQVSKQLQTASQSRMDELFAKFPEHLAAGTYGARTLREDEPVHFESPDGRLMHSAARTLTNAQGIKEHCALQFDPELEPATAALVAELNWLNERRAALANSK